MPAVPAAGVPLRRPVLASKWTPSGKALTSLTAGVGKPVAVTVNVPAAPPTNVVLEVLVTAGGWLTVSVNDCVASLPTPLLAVKEMA